LLGAQSSGAQVIALANAGADTVNAVKQAGEFGIVPKQVIATPALFITDIRSLGLETAAGLHFITSSYPDMDDGTRRWSAEFLKRRGTMPSMTHAGMYSAAQHYLKAVEAAGTTEGRAVAQKMQEFPVENVFTHQGRVRADGQMVHDLFFAQVKQPEESRGEWDLFKILYTIPTSTAFRPLEESECPLVKATK
jgi:branched-chain amino acid transport system substrate-binding protein